MANECIKQTADKMELILHSRYSDPINKQVRHRVRGCCHRSFTVHELCTKVMSALLTPSEESK